MTSENVRPTSFLIHSLDGQQAKQNMLGHHKLEPSCTKTATPRNSDVIYRLVNMWKWPMYRHDSKDKRDLREYKKTEKDYALDYALKWMIFSFSLRVPTFCRRLRLPPRDSGNWDKSSSAQRKIFYLQSSFLNSTTALPQTRSFRST